MGASLTFGNKLYIATLFVTIYNTKLHHKFQFATQCHSFNSAPRMHAHISSCCSATPQQAVNKRSCRGWVKAFKQVHVQKLLVLFWSVSDALNSSEKNSLSAVRYMMLLRFLRVLANHAAVPTFQSPLLCLVLPALPALPTAYAEQYQIPALGIKIVRNNYKVILHIMLRRSYSGT